MDNEEEYSDDYLRRYQNLKMFKGKTNDEIRAYLKSRPPKQLSAVQIKVKEEQTQVEQHNADALEYDKLFKSKLKLLQKEYSVDMNNANDAESLKSLVRHMIQLEEIDKQIRKFYESKSTNTKGLKDLGDYQRSIQTSITALQEQLGISRKVRKEKNVDDVPKYIENLQNLAMDFLNKKTTIIRCEKDSIELARFWINFPNLNNHMTLEFECWKCHEVVLYAN